MTGESTVHVPVLLAEVLEALQPQPGQTLVDATLGGGGHTRALADRVGPSGRILAFDLDPAALARAELALKGLPVSLVHASFAEIPQVLDQLRLAEVDAVLMDLGLSSDQLADDSRGFSFQSEGPLDLRFDSKEGQSATELLRQISQERLADLLHELGEERFARRIARRIVEQRREHPITTARQLADLVRACVPRRRDDRIDPATRTFQALRIAVNGELESLDRALRDVPSRVRPGGRLAIISFHSLEDRRVKQAFRDDPRLTPITRRPIVPSEAEVAANPRARSAKLRVAQRQGGLSP